MVEGDIGNNGDWCFKFCRNAGEYLNDRIIKVGYSFLNKTRECVDNRIIIDKSHSFLNNVD